MYFDILRHTIIVIAKTNCVFFIILVFSLIICSIIKNKVNIKKIQGVLLAGLVVVVLESCVLLVPRMIDYHQKSFVAVENAHLFITGTNSTYEDGSVLFYGTGRVLSKDGKQISVVGINFIEIPAECLNENYDGTIVYAKYSRQIVGCKKSENPPGS